jgi:3-phenylpropionate/trans-cinnamate dioxygenase ferredoxin reductase subunit
MTDSYVVVGGGLAAAKAVEALRSEGYDGELVLVSAESELPYERPPLSKEFLLGKKPAEDARALPEQWYADNDVQLELGTTAEALDPSAQTLQLADSRELRFDKVLLATGSAPRRLDVEGVDAADPLYLRTVEHARTLKTALETGGRRVVVVGGGWIGLEVAAAARTYGNEVTVIEPQPTPLYGPLGPELGEHFARLHREHGVTVLTGSGVQRIDGRIVVDSAGGRHQADTLVVGVGIQPRVELARQAGIDVDHGILTDASLRTSHPAVWAAGDVAEWLHPLYGKRIRVDHWANALNGGAAAGRAMAGQEVVYDRVPYFFSDQYDLGMEFSGLVAPDSYDSVVYRGDVESGEFIAFWLSNGVVQAGMNVNVWDVTDDIQALVRSRRPVDVTRLTDQAVPLSEI